MLILLQFFKLIVFVYAASTTTKEAERTGDLVARMMNSVDAETSEILNKFLSQIAARNLSFQTIFFKINWNVILSVSCWLTSINFFCKISCVFLDHFINYNIPANHLPVRQIDESNRYLKTLTADPDPDLALTGVIRYFWCSHFAVFRSIIPIKPIMYFWEGWRNEEIKFRIALKRLRNYF